MKRFLVTLALTCALVGVALGADMPTCGAPTPASSATETAPGDILVPGFTSPDDMDNGAAAALFMILDLVF